MKAMYNMCKKSLEHREVEILNEMQKQKKNGLWSQVEFPFGHLQSRWLYNLFSSFKSQLVVWNMMTVIPILKCGYD